MTIWDIFFYVDLATSSKFKLICIPIYFKWSIPFSAVNSSFFNFFMCKPDICSWGSNYTSFQLLLPPLIFITTWVPTGGQFWWSTLDLDPTPDPYLGYTFWPEYRVYSCCSSGPIYVSSELIVVGINSGYRSSSRFIFGLYFFIWIFTVLILF